MTALDRLEAAAKRWEREVVIPHCPSCARPCCKLDTVVLDLDWRRARALYRIERPRRAFDRALPPHIRKQGDTYYVHGAPCPAYGKDGRCGVYGTDLKPPSCDDFPVYVDGDAITVDLRCEAVDLDQVERALSAVAPVRRQRSDEHAELVSFVPR